MDVFYANKLTKRMNEMKVPICQQKEAARNCMRPKLYPVTNTNYLLKTHTKII